MKRTAGKQLWDIRPNVSVEFQVSARNFLLTCFLFKFAPSHKPQISLSIYFFLGEAPDIWKEAKEREITALDLALHKGHLKRNCLPSHTHVLKTSFAKIGRAIHWWKSSKSSCSPESFSSQQNSASSRSPVDSALLGAEHLFWPLAPKKAAETQQQRARYSCQPHSDCTDMQYAQTGIIWDALGWEISRLC